jgi:hypothetical protein
MESLNYSKFPFLKELGLEENNLGCYRKGEWVGNGSKYTSVNPHNNEPTAHI